MKKLLLLIVLSLSQFLFSQSDCTSAIGVCGNTSQSYTPVDHGATAETLGGCLSGEHLSVWYKFTIATAGTLTFVIDPNVDPNNPVSTDYDWAVYGPNLQCGNLGTPVRCSFAAGGGPTGLNMTSTDTTEGAGGDRFVKYMDVLPGETYYLIVDNFSTNTMGFALTWGGTATLSSAFNDPVLTPNPFITPGQPNPAGGPNQVPTCPLPGLFNFSTLTAGIVNGNPNFTVSYHNTSNDAIAGLNPITAPVMVNANDTYYYAIKYNHPTDPNSSLNGCRQTGSFKFKLGSISPSNVTLNACNNNGAGTASFDLTTANVYFDNTATKKYYPTLNDMNAGTNQILNPTNYVAVAPKTIYVKVTTTDGCLGNSTITLQFYPTVVVNDAIIESCFIDTNITTASFDLTQANVTSQNGMTKKYFKTQADALAGTNEILNPTAYISTNGIIYIKVISENGCYAIAKVTLKVLSPVQSAVLKNKTICIEDTTTLDAGPGFNGYEWSTGATTQSISNVHVGAYWVKLKTGQCWTLQTVNVYASNQPVISNIEITNDQITITANGGQAPYKYSIDGVNWQDSNVFTGLPRGEVKVYVKDNYDCNPTEIQITVPNLLNAITPNGDNKNDYIDYSALAYKKNLVFTVYDRYGNMMYKADKIRNFTWDGTSGGKKVKTGTYWYTILWTENDKNNTETKYSGWVLVKNIE